jgi:hypothetical protein
MRPYDEKWVYDVTLALIQEEKAVQVVQRCVLQKV